MNKFPIRPGGAIIAQGFDLKKAIVIVK